MLQMTKIAKVILGRKPKQWKTYSCLGYPSDCPAWTTAVHYNVTPFLLSVLTINYEYSTWPWKVILTRWIHISEEACMYFLSLSSAIKPTTSLRGRAAEADCALRRRVVNHGRACSLLTGAQQTVELGRSPLHP